uniref:Uncharacterized protein n=1 Tax=Arundo donax TaxID=35708 RepID=A0A0A9ECA9_ARUDO
MWVLFKVPCQQLVVNLKLFKLLVEKRSRFLCSITYSKLQT